MRFVRDWTGIPELPNNSLSDIRWITPAKPLRETLELLAYYEAALLASLYPGVPRIRFLVSR